MDSIKKLPCVKNPEKLTTLFMDGPTSQNLSSTATQYWIIGYFGPKFTESLHLPLKSRKQNIALRGPSHKYNEPLNSSLSDIK